ncbi:hypothetical protein [Pseudonocardia sp. TRM90224]|uniref:hypothetical protein n=1 Tax=Pseudonocardia sp. TRM90224 TaxID=2812678 RepID=UPI001E4192D4|nr:hypothetical protein [Pseudonocardia sp. TRM90224]
MPGKNIVNKTGKDLSLVLTVRSGSNTGHAPKATVSATVGHGKTATVSYGDDHDPYLDSIAVDVLDKGGLVATQEFAFQRGSTIDKNINTHDTVIVSMDHNKNLSLAFSNPL